MSVAPTVWRGHQGDSANMGLIGLLLLIAFGLVMLVYGYPLFRLLLPIYGFMVGFVVGYALIPPENWLLALIVSIGLAIALGALAFAAWSVVLAIAGVIFGSGLGLGLGVALGGSGVLLAIAGAVIGGFLFYRFRNIMVILFTALNGAWLLVAAAAELLGQEQLVTRTQMAINTGFSVSPSWIVLIGFVVAAVVGIVVQYRLFGTRDAYTSVDL